ncbi:MAG: NADH-quinone oxidoreductase subunit NuoG [Actinomycetota bacterium]
MTTTESAHDETPETEQSEVEPIVDPNAVSITINGRTVSARKGEYIIAAADRSGDYIPRFCYHPRMSSVGMCRQCMVEVEGPRGPMMVVSCMTPVAEGQIVRTETPQVKRAQEGMIELLLANHPLDCPVCDKGGECPLQDQAFSHGPGESRFIEEKRHYEKPIPISDLVLLDRERCILCDRCTRFADEVAGDALIHFISRGNNTQVQTFPDEPFSSYFSGNTVQICPVGALTAKPYRFKARPWDLDKTESTCTTCSFGCRITLESSRDEILRYQGVDSDPVNHGWLCDKGRFAFESIKTDQRLEQPMIKRDGDLVATSWNSAIGEAADLIASALNEAGPSSIAIIGGSRGTNEDAYAWSLLARSIGVDQVDSQLDDGLPASVFAYPQATIDEAASAPTVLLIGPDLKEEIPVLYLRIRDAAVNRRAKLVEFTTRKTGLTQYAWKSIDVEPGHLHESVANTLADDAVRAQMAAGPVIVIAGRSNLAESADFTMAAIQKVFDVVPRAKVLPVLRRGNARGAIQSGLTTGTTRKILEDASEGRIRCLVLVGSDPLSDVPDSALVRRALAGVGSIISVDTTLTNVTRRADVALPAAAFAEKDGTTTNIEGRVTQLARKVNVRGTARPDWMIAVELADVLGRELPVGSVSEVHDHLVRNVAAFAGVTRGALAEDPDGVLLDRTPSDIDAVTPPKVLEKAGFAYRLVVGRKLYDAGHGTAQSPSLTGLAPGAALHMHPLDLDRLGAPAGADVKVIGDRTSIIMPIVPDDAVMRGTVWAAWNQPGPNIGELIDSTQPVNDVFVESL